MQSLGHICRQSRWVSKFVRSRDLLGRAKGAAKGSCGETVVQKGVSGESVSSLLR